jgi:hypothetical protein
MKRALFVVPLVAALCWISSAPSQPPPKAAAGYQPIPPGFDFPADEAQQLRLRDTQDVAGMRRHAWMVFAGATQPSPGGEAIWETWYSSAATFSTGPQPQGVAPRGRQFMPVRQLQAAGIAQLQAPGASLIAGVMFNEPARNHIRSQGLITQQRLTEMNNSFTAATPLAQRQIQPFPRDAISLKLAWRIVRSNTVSPVPVWDGEGNPNLPNPEAGWPRVVLVDPSRTQIPADETRDIVGFPNSRVVPLNRFYNFRITAADVGAIRAANPRLRPQVGDYAVLVAMHVTTKEIPDWTWATFWWHDSPDSGPFAADRPAAVAGVWRNYLMDVTYSSETPREPDGTPNIAFNPYLEQMTRGMQSNCTSCHQGAVWTPAGTPGAPVTRGTRPPDSPLFRTGMRLDFLWSIAMESDPPG